MSELAVFEALDRLTVYIGIPREMAKEKFETIAGASSEGVAEFVDLGEISRTLGARF